jgi:hypothetical protein
VKLQTSAAPTPPTEIAIAADKAEAATNAGVLKLETD